MTCIGIKVRACLPRGRALSLVVKCSTRTQDMQTTWLSKVLGGQEKHKSHKARCSPCNINHPNGVLFSWTEESTGCVKVPRTSSKAKQRRWKHIPSEWHVIVHKSGAVEKWHAFMSSRIVVFAIRMHFFYTSEAHRNSPCKTVFSQRQIIGLLCPACNWITRYFFLAA